MFNGILERNGLNYQPITDRMCASELNQIKSFIFKTIVVYISTWALSYIFCMCFRCCSTCYMPKFHKTSKLCSRMSGMIQNDSFGVSPLNCFALEKYWWCFVSERLLIYVALYVFWGWLSHFVLVSRQNFRSQTKKFK